MKQVWSCGGVQSVAIAARIYTGKIEAPDFLERKREAWLRYYAENREAQRARNRENYARRKCAGARAPTATLTQIRAERTARQRRAMGIA